LEFKEIKQIVDLMKRSDLSEFELEEDSFRLRICRGSTAVAHASIPAPVQSIQPAPAAPPSATPAPADESKLVKSPMVGTFYSAPSPDSPPFVKVGDAVGEESVLCIIEAMKVMNEIKAEKRGSIAEVLVENGESVEFGQPLFRLR
jgi:acetyl-CoA carboxylase biotin carboxyl carrier protein